jgi:transcriptional regulator with XRE-family HTH domain
MESHIRETYQPKYPLGEYIKRWCYARQMTQKEFAKGIGYSRKSEIFQLKAVSINTYFKIVEYMTRNSGLTEEFYLSRIKAVIQNEYLFGK